MTPTDLPLARQPGRRPAIQCGVLLSAFERGERLTVLTAMEKYQIYALSQRCGELKRRYGVPIKSEMIALPNGKRVAEYSL